MKKKSLYALKFNKTVYICTTISGNGLQELISAFTACFRGLEDRKRGFKKTKKKVLEKRNNELPLPNFHRKKRVKSEQKRRAYEQASSLKIFEKERRQTTNE